MGKKEKLTERLRRHTKDFTYKGYTGEYQQYNDGKDSTIYYAGDIPSVSRFAKVMFEGETIQELTEDFHAAVEHCIAQGYEPQVKSHRVTIPGALYAQLNAKAKQSGVSVSHYISHALASIAL